MNMEEIDKIKFLEEKGLNWLEISYLLELSYNYVRINSTNNKTKL